jgi:hypothetical protein
VVIVVAKKKERKRKSVCVSEKERETRDNKEETMRFARYLRIATHCGVALNDRKLSAEQESNRDALCEDEQ